MVATSTTATADDSQNIHTAPTTLYIDLSDLNPPLQAPRGYSNSFNNTRVLARFSAAKGSVCDTITSHVLCLDAKPFLFDTKGTCYLRASDRNDLSKCFFFTYEYTNPSEVEKHICYIHTRATNVHEFVQELAEEEVSKRETLMEWLDRRDMELFVEFPRNVGRKNGNGSGYWYRAHV
jgi:hypothetical protein